MNNTDKATINRLYTEYLGNLSSIFMNGSQEDIVKASAKLVALQEIMEALNVKVDAPKEVKKTTGGYQPTVAPKEIVPPKAPPAYKPNPQQVNVDFSKLQGMSPDEIFKALEGKVPVQEKKQEQPRYNGPQSLVSHLPSIDPFNPNSAQSTAKPVTPTESGTLTSMSDVLSDDMLNRLAHLH